jgi:competence protein ComFC
MITRMIADFFFPSSCAVCGKTFVMYGKMCCEKCSEQLHSAIHRSVPDDFRDRAIYWDSLASCMKFDSMTSRLIHMYKSGKRKYLASSFAQTMILYHGDQVRSSDFITSVPPSTGKNKKRGFDPAGEIARKMSSQTGMHYKTLLAEKCVKGEQKRLGQEDRYIHSIGRFESVCRESLSGRKIVLVDDVVTTGATINECARILKKMGAAHVFSLTVAQVDIKKIEKTAL